MMGRSSVAIGGVERVSDVTGEKLREEFLSFLENYREETAQSLGLAGYDLSQSQSVFSTNNFSQVFCLFPPI